MRWIYVRSTLKRRSYIISTHSTPILHNFAFFSVDTSARVMIAGFSKGSQQLKQLDGEERFSIEKYTKPSSIWRPQDGFIQKAITATSAIFARRYLNLFAEYWLKLMLGWKTIDCKIFAFLKTSSNNFMDYIKKLELLSWKSCLNKLPVLLVEENFLK